MLVKECHLISGGGDAIHIGSGPFQAIFETKPVKNYFKLKNLC